MLNLEHLPTADEITVYRDGLRLGKIGTPKINGKYGTVISDKGEADLKTIKAALGYLWQHYCNLGWPEPTEKEIKQVEDFAAHSF